MILHYTGTQSTLQWSRSNKFDFFLNFWKSFKIIAANKQFFFLAHGKEQEIFQDRSFVCFWGYVFLAFNAKVDIYLHFLMSLSTEKNIVN